MGGRTLAGVLSVVALALVARLLGAVDFGFLVLVHTTAIVVRGLLNFKPSDTVVRYGGRETHRGARDEAPLLVPGLQIDATNAVVDG